MIKDYSTKSKDELINIAKSSVRNAANLIVAYVIFLITVIMFMIVGIICGFINGGINQLIIAIPILFGTLVIIVLCMWVIVYEIRYKRAQEELIRRGFDIYTTLNDND